MDVIDDEGRLFGTVNVIDALVLLLVAAVVIAGAVFVLSPGPDEDTRYATVDLGTQPSYIVADLSEGDVMEVEGHSDNLTITDIYLGPAAGDDAHVIARVEITGETVEVSEDRWQFHFAGEPFRSGQELTLEMLEYQATGQVTAIGTDDPTLSTTETDVFAVATVSGEVAANLERGDAYTVNGEAVATIEELQLYPSNASQQRVLLGLSLATHERNGVDYFGSEPLRIGSGIDFETGGYGLNAEVLDLGTTSLDTEQTPVLIEATVSNAVADRVSEGDAYRISGEEIARIESVNAYPTADRDRTLLVLGLELETVIRGEETIFGDRAVRDGVSIPFRTPEYELAGQIVDPHSAAEPGEPTTTEVTLKKTNVHPDRGDRIHPGMTEAIDGVELAELTAVDREPAEVILESEDGDIFRRDHPVNEDLTITAELETRETPTQMRFHGEEIREGDTIVLDLGRLTIQVELIEIHD